MDRQHTRRQGKSQPLIREAEQQHSDLLRSLDLSRALHSTESFGNNFYSFIMQPDKSLIFFYYI